MSRGFFISLEGSEGCGKSTQAAWLAERLRDEGFRVRSLREPGGTALGEEIRHTVKHSAAGQGMSAEAELLLINAARAQLVRPQILRDLGVSKMRLLSSPRKMPSMTGFGLEITGFVTSPAEL